MAKPPKLTEAEVRAWVGETSLDKGRPYFRQGDVFDLRRHDQTLRGLCQGSMDEPYRVTVELGPSGIQAAACSCPVGGGGRCKHVAALLLAWLNAPQTFEERPDPNTLLGKYSQAELVTLVRRMLDRYPDLERMLDRYPPRSQRASAVKPEVIRRQVATAFRSAGHEWGAASAVAAELHDLVAMGDEYAGREEWANALVVYEVVARETLEAYGDIDDEGDVLSEVNECVTGLGECLEHAEDLGEREIILEALFDIYKWDIDYGGVAVGEDVPDIILAQASADERRQVARWIREALPDDESDKYNFRRQAYGGFLLRLAGDETDDETFLAICRETGRTSDLVNRLLELGRVDEAAADARQTSDYTLLQLADLFVKHGHADLAERLVRERRPRSQDSRLTQWLLQRTEARGDREEALTLALDLFWQQPSLPGYQRVRALAQALERWMPLHKDILARLAEKDRYELLTDIHLDEGDVAVALTTVDKIRPGWGYVGELSYFIRVAQAAEANYPEAAIRIYVREAQRLIEQRGRPNYAQAAAYLKRVRDLYRRLGQDPVWQELIDHIRVEYKALRALREELANLRL